MITRQSSLLVHSTLQSTRSALQYTLVQRMAQIAPQCATPQCATPRSLLPMSILALNFTSKPQSVDWDTYIQNASLSPFVPTPDIVASRIFDTLGHPRRKGPPIEAVGGIVTAAKSRTTHLGTTHLDLGCGWGALNRASLGRPSVGRTVGVDNDSGMLREAESRGGGGEIEGTEVVWVEGNLQGCKDLR